MHAKRLSTGRSDLFGLVISESANPYFPEIIRGFQAAAWDREFDVLLCDTEYRPERTQSILDKLIQSDVRGVAIVTSSIDNSMTSDLKEAGIGAVFCNLCPSGKLISNITINYQHGVLQAIEHVVALGHHRAAVIAGPEHNRAASNIKSVLLGGLKRRGINPYPVTSTDYHLNAGDSAVRDILSADDVPRLSFAAAI